MRNQKKNCCDMCECLGVDATRRSHSDGIKIPMSLHEVDNGKILGFGADLAEDHPVGHNISIMMT